MDPKKNIFDCIIVGGGPAGLLASIYLCRFKRKILLIDAGKSRALFIKTSHNYPCAIHPKSGSEILSELRKQLSQYTLSIVEDCIGNIEKTKRHFTCQGKLETYLGKTILIASGVTNIEPCLPNVITPIANSYINHCMVCDGYEASNKKIAVLGDKGLAVKEAVALQTYSDDITILTHGNPLTTSDYGKKLLKKYNIKCVEDPIIEAIIENEKITGFRFATYTLYFDSIYSGVGSNANTLFTSKLAIKRDFNGCIYTNRHQCTRMPGVYAAGDVTVGLDQISIAFGQAAIAALNMHLFLKKIRHID